ncbi:hypothetical protein F2Q69_00027676 [Brassica cretica]|uniref:Uncharacterized protein n=1 Tax=Brassica cretica TaxID=69181 RepID=A0A8S9RXI6_BRACR|nr:hypothetical protein F2Q69_00027676 [Brassica cretica]
MKREKTQQFNIVVNESETKSISNRFVSETYLNLQANPAAMSRSMNSGEHVTLKRFQLSGVPPLVRLPHRVLSSPEESVDWKPRASHHPGTSRILFPDACPLL